MAREEQPEARPAEIRLPDPLKKLLGTTAPQPLELVGPTFAEQREAEEWARLSIRGLGYVEYSGADLDVVNALNQMVQAIAERYEVNVPAIAPCTWDGWKARSAAFMSANREGIRFNPLLTSGFRKEFFVGQWELGQHTSAAAKGLEAIVAHEMAHLLEESGRHSTGRLLDPSLSLVIVRKYARILRETLGQEGIAKELSGYAWRGDGTMKTPAQDAWRETWAQAFSAYTMAPALLTRDVVTMVETVLQELRRF